MIKLSLVILLAALPAANKLSQEPPWALLPFTKADKVFIWAATSDNLVDWTPVEKRSGETDPVRTTGQVNEVCFIEGLAVFRSCMNELLNRFCAAQLDHKDYEKTFHLTGI